jgi:hypothetical protein
MNIDFNLVIVDEAHHLQNDNVWRNMLDNLNCYRFAFFSATLYDEYSEIDFGRDIDFGVENGYLTDYALMIPVFREISDGDNYMNQLAELIVLHPEWTHILAYCNSLESASRFNDILNNATIPSIYFDGSYKIAERNKIIDGFNNSKYRVLSTVQVLSEGLNIPIANTCIFVEPRNSAINVAQCVGRISRLHSTKLMSYVILPSVNEETDLKRFLKLMGNYDKRLYKMNTSRNARLNIMYDLVTKDDNENADNNDNSDNELLYLKIYENIRDMISENSGNWMNKYSALIEYLTINNKLPTRSDDNFGYWITTQRACYKRHIMPTDRIELLNNLQLWVWNAADYDNIWMNRYNALVEYITINNKLPKQSDNNFGKWIARQRIAYKQNKMHISRVKLLNQISLWAWDVANYDNIWMNKYNALVEYLTINNKLPKQSDDNIGKWINTQRVDYKRNKLSINRIELLNNLQLWVWDINYDNIWMNKYNALAEYLTINNKLPKQSDDNFGKWLHTHRVAYKRNKLSINRIELLNNLPLWIWDATIDINAIWMNKYDALVEYITVNNKLPKYSDNVIGKWIVKQRQEYKNHKTTTDRIDLLNKLPLWVWDSANYDDIWINKYNELVEYLTINNKLPKRSNDNLGKWISVQRTEYKKNKMQTTRVELLNQLPLWIWDAANYDDIWMNIYNELAEYITINNKLPKQSDKKFGSWIDNQRQEYKKNKMSINRVELLNQIPLWLWNGIDINAIWMNKYNELVEYLTINNKLPTRSDINLGCWINTQRREYKNNKTTTDRIDLLNILPLWKWLTN